MSSSALLGHLPPYDEILNHGSHNCGGITDKQRLISPFKTWMIVGLLASTFVLQF